MFGRWQDFGFLVLYSSGIGVPVIYTNRWISRYVNRRIPFLRKPLNETIFNITSIVITSLIFYFTIRLIMFSMIRGTPLQVILKNTSEELVPVLILIIFIICFFLSVEFFKNWQTSVVNEERLKREAIELQLASLKNQVNPHFLFNTLNVLTSLIPKDPEASIRFVKQLSEVYRYVLEQNAKDTTNIKDELQFLKSYVYLQKIRFGESFQVLEQITVPDFQIIPLALQMLLENAIKHNIVSDEKPLVVKIYDSDDYLIVENNLQKKSAMFDSNQIGLKNIQFRYEFLSRNKMEVISTEGKFIVKLPKLKMMSNESINR